jgi:hypothetical protein
MHTKALDSATTGVTNATGIYGGDAVEEMEIVPV